MADGALKARDAGVCTARAPRLPRAVSAAALGLAVVYAAVSVSLPHSFRLTVFGDAAQLLLAALVTVAFAYHAVRGQARIRFFWGMMAVGAACWFVSQAWSYYELIRQVAFDEPSLQDIVLFLHLVPMMAALAMLPHEPRKMPAAIPYSLGMLAVWWMYLYAYIVIPWQYIYPNLALYGPSFNLLYSTEDLAFIAALGVLAWKSAGAWRTFYGRLLLGSLGYTISAQITNAAIDRHRYYTGSYFDIPLVFSVCAFAGRPRRQRNPGWKSPRTPIANPPPPAGSRLAFLALLSVPLLAAWSLSFSHVPVMVRNFRVCVSLIAVVALSALLFALQWLLGDRLRESLKTVKQSMEPLASARETLQHQATHDFMIGCLNRLAITDALSRELSRATPRRTAARRLPHRPRPLQGNQRSPWPSRRRYRAHCRLHSHAGLPSLSRITSGRYGGEEFLAVIPDADEATTLQIAERIRDRISMTPVVFNANYPIMLTATIGVALSQTGDTPETLLRRADLALYRGKRLGRDTVQVARKEAWASLEPAQSVTSFTAVPNLSASTSRRTVLRLASGRLPGATVDRPFGKIGFWQLFSQVPASHLLYPPPPGPFET